MKASQNCIDFIKPFENLELKAYICPAGKTTIGYGSTMYSNGNKVKMGEVITKEKAEAELKWQVDTKAKSIDVFLDKVVITQNQFDALTSFSHNAGVGNLEKSTLLKVVRRNPNNQERISINDVSDGAVKKWMKDNGKKDINAIHYEFMRWCRGGGKVLNGLLRRRNEEYQLYSKP